jgi:hypothetical protein
VSAPEAFSPVWGWSSFQRGIDGAVDGGGFCNTSIASRHGWPSASIAWRVKTLTAKRLRSMTFISRRRRMPSRPMHRGGKLQLFVGVALQFPVGDVEKNKNSSCAFDQSVFKISL